MTTNETTNENNAKPNNWLQRLKDESWEAELIISTVAIFGTVQMFKMISWMTDWFINVLPPSQYFNGYMVSSFGLFAVSLLTTMFVIHFLMRAYWVGLVGLNSVFPDYGLEDSAYSEIYTNKMLAILPKLKDTISKVDDLCSVIFSAAFFLFFMYAYISAISIVILLIYVNFVDLIPPLVLAFFNWAIIVFGFGMMIISAIANIKYFKKNESIQTLYFNLIRWSSIITMGPLYKYILQISMSFATNYKKKKALVRIIIAFAVFGCIVTVTQIFNSNLLYLINTDSSYNESKLYNHYYRSSYEGGDFLLGPQIDSEVMNEPLLRLFIPIYSYESKIVTKMYGEVKRDDTLSEKEGSVKKRKAYIERYTKYHSVKVDGNEIPISFKRYTHPDSKQFGVLAFIDINGYSKGEHTLSIQKKLEEESKDWEIPFFYY